jgi:hypothetical protein
MAWGYAGKRRKIRLLQKRRFVINRLSVLAIIFGIAIAVMLVRLFHHIAAEHRWEYVPRYVCGGLIVMAAFAPVLFTALEWELAGALTLILGVMFAAAGLMTWLEHDADRQREVSEAITQAEQMNRKIKQEMDR